MDPLTIIQKYYNKDSEAYRVLVTHSSEVAKKALDVAKRYRKKHPEVYVDMQLIQEAAMLHDIGSCMTSHSMLGKKNGKHYLFHGVLGREILDKEGLYLHGLICERHIGVGITKKEIIAKDMPLPKRDMVPETIEEEIVCYADCFFSKDPNHLEKEESLENIRTELRSFGADKVAIFDQWVKKFDA
jgi:uncharacterized protein